MVADLWSEVLDTLEWRAAASPMWCSQYREASMARVSSRRFVTLSARWPPDSSSLADGRQDSPTLLMGYGEGVLPPPVHGLSPHG